MNTAHFSTTRRAALLLLLAAAASFCAPNTARATLLFSGIDLGDAGRTTQWAIFALSGGITATDTTSGPTISGGNIGASGGGSITLSGTAKVNGDAYIKTGGVLRKSGTAGFTTGHSLIQNSSNDLLMNKVVSDANNAAATANGLANYSGAGSGVTYSNWPSQAPGISINQNTPLGIDDTTGSAHVVLHLSDFVLSGGAELTLDGGTMTTYVINVSGQFSLLGGKITLMGGVMAENVLFNITGPGADVSLTAAANFNGFLFATQRTVNLSGGSQLNGTLIANKVNVSGASRVTQPPYTSP